MNFSKKLSLIITVLAIALSCFVISTSAASSATLFFSKNDIEVGEKVNISVGISPNESMTNLTFHLRYDNEILQFESGDGSQGSDGVVDVSKTLNGEKSVKYSFSFTALKAGKSTISVVDCVYISTTEKMFIGASAALTVKGETLSSDATLKSLKISGHTLSPSFLSSKTSYKVTVPYETENVNVAASTTDKKAKIKSISGDTELKVGKNTVTVTVVAEDNTEKKYKITVTREEKEETSSAEDTSSNEETIDFGENTLETVISGKTYKIITEIPDSILIKGFKAVYTNVNGYTIETAVDEKDKYCLFYLVAPDSEEALPYIFDSELDTFTPLKHAKIGDNTYIFATLPEDYAYPESMYPSNVTINGFSVECLADSNKDFDSFKYLYCYYDGAYNLYRYDTKELTLQRYPDFELKIEDITEKNDNVFTRFSSLSTNGKIIMIAFLVVILGVFALLIMLIVYVVRRSMGYKNGFVYDDDDDDFDEVEVKKDNTTV